MLPLDKDVWLEKLYEVAKNTERDINASMRLREQGFDISEQIKVLERIYAWE